MKQEIGRTPRILLLLGIATYAAPSVQAGQYLDATRSSVGAWSFQDVESPTINGKEKVRSALFSEGRTTTWDSKSINRITDAHISSFAALRVFMRKTLCDVRRGEAQI
jgi:hypothetical protein